MRFVKAFGRFWFDFIIGDDWKIAAAVGTAVALVIAGLTLHWFGDTVLSVLGAIVIMAAFSVSLLVDVRPALRRDADARKALPPP